MVTYRLFCFGQPTIESEGQAIKLEMRKSLALLVYLRLAGRSCPRESLAELFWPEYDQAHAQANFRRALSSLHRSLESNVLEVDRDSIRINEQAEIWLDVDEFTRNLKAGKAHHIRQEVCSECLGYFEAAIQLYRGDFLEGFNLADTPEFDEWQFLLRENLKEDLAYALARVAEYCATNSQWENAIRYTRRWISQDILSEQAHRFLISLLAQSGQRSAAMKQYQELVNVLNDELGQKPEDETVELFRKIQGGGMEPDKRNLERLLVEPLPGPVLEPLLKTKLFIPFSRGKYVPRERLVHKLDEIKEYALTLLSAPAGFGKTTALAEWINESTLPVGWISLDKADNHLPRFFTYLVAALDSIENSTSEKMKDLMKFSQPIDTQVYLTNFILELEKISNPFALIFDDYHLIKAEAIHEMISYLLDHLPRNAHLVIATRADPPLNLARLRSKNQLLEIRTEALRFTPEEALVLFNEIMGLGISDEDSSILGERAEGWAVGLQMAALSLKKQPDKSSSIRAFSGSNRYILDYLIEEVIQRQPEFVQNFLLQTSILEQMNGALCDAVTGIREWKIDGDQVFMPGMPLSSQEILEYLDRTNLFVISLDDERCWYRYHHLFADLLSARLDHYYPDLVKELHRRASEWYEQNGYLPTSVNHALASGAYDLAAKVIERALAKSNTWNSGDLAMMIGWVNALPGEVLLENPMVQIYACGALYAAGQFKAANQMLEQVGEALPEIKKKNTNPSLIEQGYLMNLTRHAAILGNISTAIEAVNQGRHIKTNADMAKFLSGNYLLIGYLAVGDVTNALRVARPAYEAAVQFGFSFHAIFNAKNTADVYLLQGRLKDALALCDEAIERCKLKGLHDPVLGIVGLTIGDVLRERNELEVAERYVQEGLDLLARGPIMDNFGQGHAILALIKQARGDRKMALQFADEAVHIAEEAGIPRVINLLKAYRVRIWLAQGEYPFAQSWAREYQLLDQTEYPREFEDMTLAQVLIQQQQYPSAANLLKELLTKAQAAGRSGREIEILVLLSVACYDQNLIEEAMGYLERTLLKAQTEGYARVYVDCGKPMETLLQTFMERRVMNKTGGEPGIDEQREYINRLLLAFQQDTSSESVRKLE